MQSAIAFGVFIAIVGYFITRSEDKKKEEEQKKINDRINDSRSMLKDSIVKRAVAFNVTDYTNEELDFICDIVQAYGGSEGLLKAKQELDTVPDDKVEGFLAQMEVAHFKHLLDNQERQWKRDEEEAWQTVLNDFKRLNPAQRKKHLTYLKKYHSDALSREQLHVLALLCLGE